MYTNTAFCFVDLLSAYNSTLQTELPLTEIVPPTYNQSRSKNYIMCNKCFNKNTFTIDYKVLGPLIEEQIKKFKEQGDNQIVILIDRVYDDLSDINTLLINTSLSSPRSKTRAFFRLTSSLLSAKATGYILTVTARFSP